MSLIFSSFSCYTVSFSLNTFKSVYCLLISLSLYLSVSFYCILPSVNLSMSLSTVSLSLYISPSLCIFLLCPSLSPCLCLLVLAFKSPISMSLGKVEEGEEEGVDRPKIDCEGGYCTVHTGLGGRGLTQA